MLERPDEDDGRDVRQGRVEIGRQTDHAGDRRPLQSERAGASPAFDAPPVSPVAHTSPRARGEVRPRPFGPCRPGPPVAARPHTIHAGEYGANAPIQRPPALGPSPLRPAGAGPRRAPPSPSRGGPPGRGPGPR